MFSKIGMTDESALRSFAPLDVVRHDYNRGLFCYFTHCFAIACWRIFVYFLFKKDIAPDGVWTSELRSSRRCSQWLSHCLFCFLIALADVVCTSELRSSRP